MSFTKILTTTFVPETCCNCGMQFAMTREVYEQRRKDRQWFYCPAGHEQYYSGPTREQKLREQLEREQGENRDLGYRLEHANRSRAALKGQVTKIKRRVGRGICPCCNRTFADLGRHMESKHPDWHED